MDTTDAEFEILEMPQKKTFGLFGGAPAKVRAYIEEPDPVEERDPAQEAAGYLKSVLKEMGLPEAGVEIRREEASAALTLSGEDIGFIIGHRGETLDALQYLASLVANHVDGSYFRITLDVGNYREKRKETLEALGKKMAARAVKTGRNSSLEPMNPYERRIIHTAVQTVPGAKSWSEGVDQARHVVIGPEGGERPQRRNDRRGGGRNDRGRGGRGGYNDRNRRPRSDRSRPNPAPRAEGPKADDPNTPSMGGLKRNKQLWGGLRRPLFCVFSCEIVEKGRLSHGKDHCGHLHRPGAGGIGIVRLSGRKAFSIGEKVFRGVSGKALSQMKGYTAQLGAAFDAAGERLDDVVALVFRAPKSYTGEDAVELSCHGGVAVLQETLRALLDAGAELAGPGEFSKRAVLAGKMTLTQAEGGHGPDQRPDQTGRCRRPFGHGRPPLPACRRHPRRFGGFGGPSGGLCGLPGRGHPPVGGGCFD